MIVVTGPSCSGKSTFGRIARAKGCEVLETTDIVKEQFRAQGKSGEDIIEFCVRRYREVGEDVFARLNCSRIRETFKDTSRLVCVGLRAAGEVHCFREALPDVRVIGIHADTSLRYQRGLLRDRYDSAKTLEDFIHRDMREYSMGLAGLFGSSLDVLLINNKSMAEFEAEVVNHLSSLCEARNC